MWGPCPSQLEGRRGFWGWEWLEQPEKEQTALRDLTGQAVMIPVGTAWGSAPHFPALAFFCFCQFYESISRRAIGALSGGDTQIVCVWGTGASNSVCPWGNHSAAVGLSFPSSPKRGHVSDIQEDFGTCCLCAQEQGTVLEGRAASFSVLCYSSSHSKQVTTTSECLPHR